jgi:hypothetical protein
MNDRDSIVGGAETLKQLLMFGFVSAFFVVYGYFVVEIWDAPDGRPPDFDAGLISLAGALAGVLGGGFAIALGVEKPSNAPSPRLLGRLGDPFKGLSLVVTLGIWTYAVIGAAAAVTTFMNLNETPEVVKGLSAVFVGYVLSLAAGSFRTVRT